MNLHQKDCYWNYNTLATWCEDPDAGKDWRQKEKGVAGDETDSMDVNLSKLQETVEDRGAWLVANHGVTKSQTQLNDWTAVTSMAPVL